MLANAQPNANCRYIGEAIGSQGNWFTGDYTANAKLMQGARNDLRNKAVTMGGDYVWVQNQANAHAHGSLGTDNTTVVGNVYVCGNTAYAAAPADASAQQNPDTRSNATADVSGMRGVAAQVLNAQQVAKAQGCGDVRNFPGGEYAASCSEGTLIIRCGDDDCRPVQMKR